MKEPWQKYLDLSVPRYTSYPSALFFGPMEPAPYRHALREIGPYEPVSLYIHVPFCQQLCWYCGCNMRVENRYERTRPYLDALKREIHQVAAALAGRGRTSQLHFGGGTPNFLHAEDLISILDEIENAFGLTDGTPIAIELDPRLSSAASITNLARIGVTRMSIGVQDFDPFVQAAINRIQSYELVHDCVAAMRTSGVGDISFDLLYGLPRQTEHTMRETLRKTLSLAPDRVSLFGYAHLPDRLRHQRLIDDAELPGRSERSALAELGADTLVSAGYRRIGFDHFALPHTAIANADAAGRLNRNFQGFTEDQARCVIGLGPSAISSVNGVHAQNEKSVDGYTRLLDEGHWATTRGIVSTPEQRLIGDWIHGLLCRHEACLAEYFNIAGREQSAMESLMDRLAPLQRDGLIQLSGDRLTIEPGARLLSRAIAAVFDPAVHNSGARLSPAV
ncbi:oxygen-independent coproporphyrinogen III oxidase [Aquisalinus flavus]|uniref:Coproporphyrinogen-III oxidase n=1 Tax=Aquisalinus flavus TaxID=1526572 RepID=A0A8J2Y827_9PROT|nr:oxygen-independent coproporphyrinogen III oxidase [Aquisalinus flavus]MBD0425892.1 oxygen-independent coproporphyrinogen III oxidase [Aquisalinus flavus]UNE48512.1 oxygen-independent coproporphyrinogen III oxidase [Aquisalinus flavus]GGD12446.1 coproporphyrinogen-III oxidase [Aquisalinus flavus]